MKNEDKLLIEQSGKDFGLAIFQSLKDLNLLSPNADEEKQGVTLSGIKRKRFAASKADGDAADEGTADAFAQSAVNAFTRKAPKALAGDSDLIASIRQVAISYYNALTNAGLSGASTKEQKAKGIVAGNGKGSSSRHIPKVQGNLDDMRKPSFSQEKRQASIETMPHFPY